MSPKRDLLLNIFFWVNWLVAFVLCAFGVYWVIWLTFFGWVGAYAVVHGKPVPDDQVIRTHDQGPEYCPPTGGPPGSSYDPVSGNSGYFL